MRIADERRRGHGELGLSGTSTLGEHLAQPHFCAGCGCRLAAAEAHKPDCRGPDGPQRYCPDCGYKNPGPEHDFGCGDMYTG